MKNSIQGKSVIITGASRGIGRGIAHGFAANGAKVMVVSRNADDLEGLVKEITEAGGVARAAACDVSDWESVQQMVEQTAKAFDGVDVLVANAGIYPQSKIVDMDPQEWDDVLNVNLKSNFLCVKACIPHFEKRPGGRVVLTSSITGPVTGFPGWTHYGASKAGQLGFLRTAALELSRYKTTINAVMPGSILTEGLAELGEDFLEAAAEAIPLRRIGSVADIANSTMFFASDYASYITGQTLIVDGGQILPETADAISEI